MSRVHGTARRKSMEINIHYCAVVQCMRAVASRRESGSRLRSTQRRRHVALVLSVSRWRPTTSDSRSQTPSIWSPNYIMILLLQTMMMMAMTLLMMMLIISRRCVHHQGKAIVDIKLRPQFSASRRWATMSTRRGVKSVTPLASYFELTPYLRCLRHGDHCEKIWHHPQKRKHIYVLQRCQKRTEPWQ